MVRRFFVLLILLAVPFTACADSTAGSGTAICTAATPTAGPSGSCGLGVGQPYAVPLPRNAAGIPLHVPTYIWDGQYGNQTFGTSINTSNAQSIAATQAWVTFAEGNNIGGTNLGKNGADCTPNSNCYPVFQLAPGLVSPQPTTEGDAFHRDTGSCPGGPRASGMMAWNWLSPNYWAALNADYPGVLANPVAGDWIVFRQEGTQSGLAVGAYPSSKLCEAQTDAQFQVIQSYRLQRTLLSDGTRALSFRGNDWRGINVSSPPQEFAVGPAIGMVNENNLGNTTSVTPSYVSLLTILSAYQSNPNFTGILLLTHTATPGSTTACASNGTGCGDIPMRLLATGFAWLGYNTLDTNLALWMSTSVSTILQVYPEAQIVPWSPIRSMSPAPLFGANGLYNGTSWGNDGTGCNATGVDPNAKGGLLDLVVACGTSGDSTAEPSGVYIREFRSCYNWGTLIGGCAVVFNSTNASFTPTSGTTYLGGVYAGQPALTQTYTHMITNDGVSLVGGDVLTAGCGNGPCPSTVINPAATTFTLGTTSVAPDSAILLFP
jgi:hypothetical protein